MQQKRIGAGISALGIGMFVLLLTACGGGVSGAEKGATEPSEIAAGSGAASVPSGAASADHSDQDTCIAYVKWISGAKNEMQIVQTGDKTQGSDISEKWAGEFKEMATTASPSLKQPILDLAANFKIGARAYWVTPEAQADLSKQMNDLSDPAWKTLGETCSPLVDPAGLSWE